MSKNRKSAKVSVAPVQVASVVPTAKAKPVKVNKAQAVAAPVAPKTVSKAILKASTAKPAAVQGTTVAKVTEGKVVFANTARITLVTQGNPRKENAPGSKSRDAATEHNTPFKRYAVIMQIARSKDNTVEAFLKVLPKWRATLERAMKDGHISIATLTAAVLVGGMLYNVPVV